MTGKTADFLLNGANGRVTLKSLKPTMPWRRIHMNEWTFNSLLFAISLTVVLGKLCINYGSALHQQSNTKYPTRSVALVSNASGTIERFKLPDSAHSSVLAVTSGELTDKCIEYGDVVGSAVISFATAYGWLMRAALCGLIMIGYTWFIIYKDSSIPGINPPVPFSPPKYRLPDAPKLQMNYLVGILNGILLFVYMCL